MFSYSFFFSLRCKHSVCGPFFYSRLMYVACHFMTTGRPGMDALHGAAHEPRLFIR